MLKKILLALGVLVAGFLTYVALKPSEMLISREIEIQAKPEVIFPWINNSRKCNEWMPWQSIDPSAKMTYTGPDEGMGSTSAWASDGQMGTGQAEVVESVPNLVVKTKLTYTKPMEMSQLAEVTLTPTPSGTRVRWSVSGHNSFLGRLMCVFMNMDKTVGLEFEKGLATLKQKVEARGL